MCSRIFVSRVKKLEKSPFFCINCDKCVYIRFTALDSFWNLCKCVCEHNGRPVIFWKKSSLGLFGKNPHWQIFVPNEDFWKNYIKFIDKLWKYMDCVCVLLLNKPPTPSHSCQPIRVPIFLQNCCSSRFFLKPSIWCFFIVFQKRVENQRKHTINQTTNVYRH